MLNFIGELSYLILLLLLLIWGYFRHLLKTDVALLQLMVQMQITKKKTKQNNNPGGRFSHNLATQ